jgi:hypothetical protein
MESNRTPEEIDKLVDKIFERESKKTHRLSEKEIAEMKTKIKKLVQISPLPNEDNWDLP